jgi:hypothetical protein
LRRTLTSPDNGGYAMKLGLLGDDRRPFDSCVAGYSRLVGADEIGTLQALKAHRTELVDLTITVHNIKSLQNRPGLAPFSSHSADHDDFASTATGECATSGCE